MSKLNTDDVTVKTITANGSIGTAGQFLTANGTGSYWSTPFLEFGQTWTNVKTTPGRVSSTTYTNSTGKNIQIMVSGTSSSGGHSLTLYVNETIIGNTSTVDINQFTNISAIIPNGASYKIVANPTSAISSWFELI